MARYLAKAFNVLSFDHHLFAYLFVENARGSVIKNVLASMLAIMHVLSERLDNDQTNDWDEYHSAVMAKRILDGLETYENE